MLTEEEFVTALAGLSKFHLLDTVRVEANSLVKKGNPFHAALLREVANRYEKEIDK